MTPEQLAAIRAIILVLDSVGSWPVGLVLLAMLAGPWLGLWVYATGQHRREKEQKTQFDAIVGMYSNNVDLVKIGYKREERWEKHADDLSGIIHLNTQMCTKLIEKINNNMYCPAVREKGPSR